MVCNPENAIISRSCHAGLVLLGGRPVKGGCRCLGTDQIQHCRGAAVRGEWWGGARKERPSIKSNFRRLNKPVTFRRVWFCPLFSTLQTVTKTCDYRHLFVT